MGNITVVCFFIDSQCIYVSLLIDTYQTYVNSTDKSVQSKYINQTRLYKLRRTKLISVNCLSFINNKYVRMVGYAYFIWGQ